MPVARMTLVQRSLICNINDVDLEILAALLGVRWFRDIVFPISHAPLSLSSDLGPRAAPSKAPLQIPFHCNSLQVAALYICCARPAKNPAMNQQRPWKAPAMTKQLESQPHLHKAGEGRAPMEMRANIPSPIGGMGDGKEVEEVEGQPLIKHEVLILYDRIENAYVIEIAAEASHRGSSLNGLAGVRKASRIRSPDNLPR
eukprot:3221931-Pyramimonas_sp.AAC.1